MAFDKRNNHALIFIGEGSVARLVIEQGDEATLYHSDNIVMVKITAINESQITGVITRSSYDPDMHSELVSGKTITFSEENIFGISRKKRQA